MEKICTEEITYYTQVIDGHTWHGFTCTCGYESELSYSQLTATDYGNWHLDSQHCPCLCARDTENPERCACGQELQVWTTVKDWTHRPIKLVHLHRCGNHSNGDCNTWYYGNNN